MGVTITGFDETQEKLKNVFGHLPDDLETIGKETAKLIVSETMAGRGPDDASFAPYSESYAKELERTHAKDTAPVNLRGAFYPGTSRPRPPAGLYDPNSEMAVQRIAVDADERGIKLTYKPARSPHMIFHQNGSGRAPVRRWFTLQREKIRRHVVERFKAMLSARVRGESPSTDPDDYSSGAA